MNEHKPLISVIMPARNAEQFIVEAVRSIQAQTYSHWEFLIMDDGSTDHTGEILDDLAARDSRIKVFHNKHGKGISAGLNTLLRAAQGEFIARMDADDISLPDRFEKQLAYLNEHPDVVACGGSAHMIDGKGKIFAEKLFPTDPDELYDMIMRMVPIQHPILMARALVMKKYRYDETMRTAEDVDMFFKLMQDGKLGNVPSIVYKYRKADTSNGYHDAKLTFWLTIKSRFRGITKYGYHPSWKGVLHSLLQLIMVLCLPSKFMVRLYEWYRFDWPAHVAILLEKSTVFPISKPKIARITRP